MSFDEQKGQEICHRNSISIATSCCLLSSICVQVPASGWFESLAQFLHQHVWKRQAHFTEKEDGEEDGEG